MLIDIFFYALVVFNIVWAIYTWRWGKKYERENKLKQGNESDSL